MFQYPISLPGQPVSGLNISSFWCRTVLHTPSAPQHVLCSISQNSPLFTRCFGPIFYFLWSLWLKAPQSKVFVSPTASEWNLTAANSPSSNTRAPDRLLLQYGCASHFSNLTFEGINSWLSLTKMLLLSAFLSAWGTWPSESYRWKGEPSPKITVCLRQSNPAGDYYTLRLSHMW